MNDEICLYRPKLESYMEWGVFLEFYSYQPWDWWTPLWFTSSLTWSSICFMVLRPSWYLLLYVYTLPSSSLFLSTWTGYFNVELSTVSYLRSLSKFFLLLTWSLGKVTDRRIGVTNKIFGRCNFERWLILETVIVEWVSGPCQIIANLSVNFLCRVTRCWFAQISGRRWRSWSHRMVATILLILPRSALIWFQIYPL